MSKWLKDYKVPKLESIADLVLNVLAAIAIGFIIYGGIVSNLGGY